MKKFAVTLMLASFALLLSGCINYDETITLNPDGSGKMIVHYSISEETVTQMEDAETPLDFDKSEIEKEFVDRKAKLEDVKTYSEDNLRHIVMTVSFKDMSEVAEMLETRAATLTPGADGSQLFEIAYPGTGEATDASATEMLKDYTWKTTVNTPGKVVEASEGGVISGGSVTWDMPIADAVQKTGKMTAKFVPGSAVNFMYIYIGAGVVVLIIVLMLAFRKKK